MDFLTDTFNNRELATFLWVLVLIVAFLLNNKIRSSIVTVIKAAPSPQLKSDRAISVLTEIGVKATQLHSEELKDKAIQGIKAIATILGYDSGHLRSANIGGLMGDALNEFISTYEQSELKKVDTDNEE